MEGNPNRIKRLASFEGSPCLSYPWKVFCKRLFLPEVINDFRDVG
jgi:hypothetical protein